MVPLPLALVMIGSSVLPVIFTAMAGLRGNMARMLGYALAACAATLLVLLVLLVLSLLGHGYPTAALAAVLAAVVAGKARAIYRRRTSRRDEAARGRA